MNDEQQNTDKPVEVVEHAGVNKFVFLRSVYDRYKAEIGARDQSVVQMNDVKDILYSIHQEIYDEFISLGSVHQINIAHKTRQQLTSLLRDHPNPDWIRTFDDFLNLFDEAMRQIYRLLVGMYAYEFKSWVGKKNIPCIENSNPVISASD